MTIRKTIRSTIRRPYYDLVKPGSKLNPFEYEINIQGDSEDRFNPIVAINIHNGNMVGQGYAGDAFMSNRCKADFSDVYFKDAAGNKLDHYLVSKGNHNFTFDTKWHNSSHHIHYNGKVYAIATDRVTLRVSEDGGETWDDIYLFSGIVGFKPFIDSRGYIFVSNSTDHKVYRSTDGGYTFSVVLDFANVNGQFVEESICEDLSNNMYIGRYQNAFSVNIYKSIDGGGSWNSVYSETIHQHVHSLNCDPNTGYIYAGLDGNNFALIRSVDEGVSWTELHANNATTMYFGDGFRLFGCEPNGTLGSIYRTTDDIVFTPVLTTGHMIRSIVKLNGSNELYAHGETWHRNWYPQFFKSSDDGVTWETIRIFPKSETLSQGYYHRISNKGVIYSDNNESLLYGFQQVDSYELPSGKLIAGENNYEAFFYVKIPLLPTTGINIKAITGGHELSTLNTFEDANIPGLIFRYNLNEGSGTIANDSSGNGKHGTISIGAGQWNNYGIRRVGGVLPEIIKSNSSFKFNTAHPNYSFITVDNSGDDPSVQVIKNFTLLAWVNCTYLNALRIISKENGYYGWRLFVDSAGNQIKFAVGDGVIEKIYSSQIMIGNGDAHLVGVIVDDSTPAKIRFVINGHTYPEIQMTSDIVNDNTPIRIGYSPISWTQYWRGDMEDVRMYNRALTSAEVLRIYEYQG